MTGDAQTVTPLETFEAICDAADVPIGARRLDVFLRLPEAQREAIFEQLQAALAENAHAENPPKRWGALPLGEAE
jgi:hypothetical protein